MKIKTNFLVKHFYFLSIILLVSCSASTGSRYGNDDRNNEDKTGSNEKNVGDSYTLNEDFDITPYKTKIIIPEKDQSSSNKNQEVWFDYESPKNNKKKTLVGTEDGYRVLVLAADNLEEANQLKADNYFSNNSNEVYVDFEPPFYKVKVGDFESQRIADDLKFKLNQLGYKEAKVIKDKINVYK